ncbi:hypothetical protein OE88DRAFT_1668566 [Heliocybe sulcata]|uniref:Uncharacterized protein n=1 Tax=Heliocybe sulcata TaxID=5364 RepID=A0A5C3MKK9_9AGAM|nr:hypothetical protein OE88DRAFT_1668566 [Heliocybe sulcata]
MSLSEMSANVFQHIQRKDASRLTPNDVIRTRLTILRYLPLEIVDMILELAAYLPSSMKASYTVPATYSRSQVSRFSAVPHGDIRFESPPLPMVPGYLRVILRKRAETASSITTQVARVALAVKRRSGEVVPLRLGFAVAFKQFTKSWTASFLKEDFSNVTRQGDKIVVLLTFSQARWHEDLQRIEIVVENESPWRIKV